MVYVSVIIWNNKVEARLLHGGTRGVEGVGRIRGQANRRVRGRRGHRWWAQHFGVHLGLLGLQDIFGPRLARVAPNLDS